MLRTRIIMLLVMAAMVFILFSLPKVVVDNENEGLAASEGIGEETSSAIRDTQSQSIGEGGPDATDFDHSSEFTAEQRRIADNLIVLLSEGTNDNPRNSAIFADSLATLFVTHGKFDSAATYFEIAASLQPTTEALEKAGNAYYEAFTYAQTPETAAELGAKAREYLGGVLEADSGRYDLQTKMAMTLVSSSNPMEGILMLREVAVKDPNNRDALYNLGILGFQTGQYETAAGRFEKLVELDDGHVQARFYLGLCYKELGEPEKARMQFLKVKELDSDPEVQATVDSYLADLK